MSAIDPIFIGTSRDRRPDAVSLDYYDSFSMGPSVLADATLGVQNRPWHVHYDPTLKKVTARRTNDANDGWAAWQDIFTHTGNVFAETDACFDQQGRILFVGERDGEVWVYYFNPTVGAFTFTSLGEGRTPRTALDNPLDLTTSDVLIFYFKDSTNDLRFRMQRDKYLVEYVCNPNAGSSIPALNSFLEDVYQSRDNRLHILYSIRGGGRYTLNHVESLLYPRSIDPDSIRTGVVPSLGGLTIAVYLVAPAGFVDPGGHLPNAIDEIEAYTLGVSAASGTNKPILTVWTLNDVDEYTSAGVDAISGILVTALLLHTLYDIDSLTSAGVSARSGTVVLVVLVYVAYDNDALTSGVSVQSGSLV